MCDCLCADCCCLPVYSSSRFCVQIAAACLCILLQDSLLNDGCTSSSSHSMGVDDDDFDDIYLYLSYIHKKLKKYGNYIWNLANPIFDLGWTYTHIVHQNYIIGFGFPLRICRDVMPQPHKYWGLIDTC